MRKKRPEIHPNLYEQVEQFADDVVPHVDASDLKFELQLKAVLEHYVETKQELAEIEQQSNHFESTAESTTLSTGGPFGLDDSPGGRHR
ncbi:hypothetical protein AUR64_02115 [Haloprofundus marisrubri]|uniref:Uncharacterized protein n=2 Tax=Haloprofundus marisrubri TaxID=1514971 RepID=A0A0W1R395_9EURY|nr:hypothetical protein AUR64_02115 [Haloprofundus marisrubri]